MTEKRQLSNPESAALEAISRVWGQSGTASGIKEKGLEILDNLKIKSGVFEREAYDINKVDVWYLGQIYKALESENNRDLENLLLYQDRYFSREFFGKSMHDVFGVAEAGHGFDQRKFDREHPGKYDWLSTRDKVQSKLLGEYPDQQTFQGREVAILVKDKYPDMPHKVVEGILVRYQDDKNRSSIYHIKTGSGEVVDVDLYKGDFRVKDVSKPTYREIVGRAQDDGYVEGGYGHEFNKGESFRWVIPDKENGKWRMVLATVVKPRSFSSSLFTVRVGEMQVELNTNTFFSDGNQMFVRERHIFK